jgi:hypothetical protein
MTLKTAGTNLVNPMTQLAIKFFFNRRPLQTIVFCNKSTLLLLTFVNWVEWKFKDINYEVSYPNQMTLLQK